MIPYFAHPLLQLGPFTVHLFGITVAIAVVVGLAAAERRFRRYGLDPVTGGSLGAWTIVFGMLGAHLFSVLLYFPGKVLEDPWILLRLWEDISSFGGILGGIAGAFLFFAIRGRHIDGATRWAYLDAIAFVFPGSLAIGRFGCALAHDHPGTVTTFPLAVSIKGAAALHYIRAVYSDAGLALPNAAYRTDSSVGFHDLGWYEFLFLTFVVVPLFQFWSRRDRARGFYFLAFPAVYLPVRFGGDFLRVADVRYAGLTPAQWVCVIVLAVLPFVVFKRSKYSNPVQ